MQVPCLQRQVGITEVCHGVIFMGCQQDADAVFTQAPDHVAGLLACLAVHVGHRLIQQQHARAEYARPRKGDSLALATGEFTRITQLQVPDTGPVQRIRDLAGDVLDRQFLATQPIGNIIGDTAVKQVGILVQVYDMRAHLLAGAPPRQRLVIERHGDAVRCFKAGNNAHQGRLAGTVAATQCHTGLLVDHQRVDIQQQLAMHALAEIAVMNDLAHDDITPRPWKKASSPFKNRAMDNSTIPSAIAWENSPLLVSSAIAVGMFRV